MQPGLRRAHQAAADRDREVDDVGDADADALTEMFGGDSGDNSVDDGMDDEEGFA